VGVGAGGEWKRDLSGGSYGGAAERLREMAARVCTRGVGPAFYRRRSPRGEATRGEGGVYRCSGWRPAADVARPSAASAKLNTPRAWAPRRLGLGAASGRVALRRHEAGLGTCGLGKARVGPDAEGGRRGRGVARKCFTVPLFECENL
jgi:hypothetical protein